MVQNSSKSDQITTVQIPLIRASQLCPVTALATMLAAIPAHKHQPLFAVPSKQCIVPLTAQQVRHTLAKITTLMGLDPKIHGFHTFRRSGATLAYQAQVPISHIKTHGTWQSDAVYTYLQTHRQTAQLATAFNHLMAPH